MTPEARVAAFLRDTRSGAVWGLKPPERDINRIAAAHREAVKESGEKPRGGISIYGHRTPPEEIEAVFRKVPWIADCAVTTRRNPVNKKRVLVMFVVPIEGKTMADLLIPLFAYAEKYLKPWQRPRKFAGTNMIRRDKDGKILRACLLVGRFEGRIFRAPSTRKRPAPKTIVVRDPLNEIHFEGVLRYDLGPPKKRGLRTLPLSHTPVGGQPINVTFHASQHVLKNLDLKSGDRVAVQAHFCGHRQLRVTQIEFLKDSVKRVPLRKVEDVVERLL